MEKKVILLVEDDAVIMDIIRCAFEREYNVLAASRCSEAIALLRNTVDIALMDYILPDGDGIDVLKEIRAVNPKLPVIIMTAYSSEEIIIKALRGGATDYVKKPLILANLRKKIADILGGRKGEEFDDNSGDRKEFILDGIAAFIENNYSAGLTRDILAKKACMNKYEFSKVFNERFGQSIKSFINNVRVKNAADLLKNHNLNIGDIAFYVGYESVEHFIRVFREIYGISPKEYRADHTKASQRSSYLWQYE